MDEPIVVTLDPAIADLVPEFLEGRRQDARAVRDLLARGDLDGIRRLGHNIKGCAAGYGFPGMGAIGVELERAAKAGDAAAVARGADALTRYLARLVIAGR